MLVWGSNIDPWQARQAQEGPAPTKLDPRKDCETQKAVQIVSAWWPFLIFHHVSSCFIHLVGGSNPALRTLTRPSQMARASSSLCGPSRRRRLRLHHRCWWSLFGASMDASNWPRNLLGGHRSYIYREREISWCDNQLNLKFLLAISINPAYPESFRSQSWDLQWSLFEHAWSLGQYADVNDVPTFTCWKIAPRKRPRPGSSFVSSRTRRWRPHPPSHWGNRAFGWTQTDRMGLLWDHHRALKEDIHNWLVVWNMFYTFFYFSIYWE